MTFFDLDFSLERSYFVPIAIEFVSNSFFQSTHVSPFMRIVSILKFVLKDFDFNDDLRNKNSLCVIFWVKKLVSRSIIFF